MRRYCLLLGFLAVLPFVACSSGNQCEPAGGSWCNGDAVVTCVSTNDCADAMFPGCSEDTIAQPRACGSGLTCAAEGSSPACLPKATSFSCTAASPIGPDTRSVAFDDFDRDGHVDIATIVTGQDSFGSVRAYRVSEGGLEGMADVDLIDDIRALATADFDGDGNVDVAVAGNDARAAHFVGVAFGHGDGTFDEPVGAPTETLVGSLAVGDVDSDGHADILAGTSFDGAHSSTTSAYIFSLRSRALVALGSLSNDDASATTATLSDLNGDGKLDAILENSLYGERLALYLGNGDGTFHRGDDAAAGDILGDAFITTADFDGDGRIDIAASTFSGIAVLYGDGEATFAPPTTVNIPDRITGMVKRSEINSPNADLVFSTGHVLGLLHGASWANAPGYWDVAREDTRVLGVLDFSGGGSTALLLNTSGGLRLVTSSCID